MRIPSRKLKLYELVEQLVAKGASSPQIAGLLEFTPQRINQIRDDLGLPSRKFANAGELMAELQRTDPILAIEIENFRNESRGQAKVYEAA